MKVISREFASEVEQRGEVEKDGVYYEFCENGKILWVNENHNSMLDFSGFCVIED